MADPARAYDEVPRNAQAPRPPDPELAAAWLLLVALDPERRAGELRERVAQATTTPAAEMAGWTELASREEEPAALVAALLTQGAAEVQGREAVEERRRAKNRARQAKRAANEEAKRAANEEAKRTAERARRARNGWLIYAGVAITLFVIACVGIWLFSSHSLSAGWSLVAVAVFVVAVVALAGWLTEIGANFLDG